MVKLLHLVDHFRGVELFMGVFARSFRHIV